MANGRAAAPAAASAPTRRHAPSTVLRSVMGCLSPVCIGRTVVEAGDDGEYRTHEPPRKIWHRNLTLELDQQAREGGQLPYQVTSRAVFARLNRRDRRKQRFRP